MDLRTTGWLLWGGALGTLLGCSSEDDAQASALAEATQPALVSDWLNRRLDLIDAALLEDGASRQDVTIASLDLSAYEQVPLNAEVTPDGSLALVSLSDGFFAFPLSETVVNAGTVPHGPGRLLFVDLERFEIVAELETGDGPMGIAITKDGTRAIVPHFGQDPVVIVDIEQRSVIGEVEVGPFGEEIALDDSGEVGLFSYSESGDSRAFATADVLEGVSEPIEASGDAAGVAFFPGTKTAYLVQSPMPLLGAQGGYDLLDLRDPMAPVHLAGERFPDAPTTYPAAPVPGRGSVVVPFLKGETLGIDEFALTADGQGVTLVQSIEVGNASFFGAYGVVVDDANRAFLSVPGNRSVIVVDLDDGAFFSVAWGGGDAGPMDIALIPHDETVD